MVSKITAAGSAPSLCLTISTPARSAQTSSWSIAAARKVSAAARITLLPSALYLAASLPIVVVLPTPLTPITRITEGMVIRPISSPPSSISATMSLISALTSAGFFIPFLRTTSLRRKVISDAVVTPTSPITSASSSSSKSSWSIDV